MKDLELSPADFIEYLFENEVNLEFEKSFDFKSKFGMRYFFSILIFLIKNNYSRKFEEILRTNFEVIILENRVRQFKNYWNQLGNKYSEKIPKKLSKRIDDRANLILNFSMKDGASLSDLNALIKSYPNSIMYNKKFSKVYKVYIKESLSKSEWMKGYQSIYISNNLLLSLYALIISGEYEKAEARDVKKLFENWYCRKTCKAIDQIFGDNSFERIKKQDNGNKSEMEKVKAQTSTDWPFPPDDLLISKDIKFQTNNSLEPFDMLNHFLLNGNVSSAMKVLENNVLGRHKKNFGIGYLAYILFKQNNLEGVRLLLKNLEDERKSNKSIYMFVLKKLLARVHKHKESRSVAKLIRNNSD